MATASRRLRAGVPYHGGNTSRVKLDDLARIFSALEVRSDLDDVERRALRGELLPQPSYAARKRVFTAVAKSYIVGQPGWVILDLSHAARQGAYSPEFVALAYLHYAIADPLTYDFVVDDLFDLRGSGNARVERLDAARRIDLAAADSEEVRAWSAGTKYKLANNILSALRDFGVLTGGKLKRSSRPELPLPAALHIVRLLYGHGARGAELLRDSVWRLFMLSEGDVADLMKQLATRGQFGFERSGDVVVFRPPAEWENES